MDAPLDLRSLEEKTFRSRFDDGLLDLVVGLFVLAFGLCLETEMAGMAAIWAAVLLPLYLPLHKKIVEPRLGYVEFSKERVAKSRRQMGLMTLALGASVLGGVGLWVVHAMDDPGLADALRPLGPIPFGLMLGLMIAVGAALVKIVRGYAYAGLVVATVTAVHLLDLDGDLRLALVCSGAAITAWGTLVLVRFLRSHPVLEDGPDADDP